MTQNIEERAKNQSNGSGVHMNKGFAIGMPICIAIGIVLSEVWGYHDVIPYSIVFGCATSVLFGAALERRHKKSNC